MKNSIQFILGCILFITLPTFLSSCKKDDPANPKTEKVNMLNGLWEVTSVKNDDVDVTGQFTGFTLSINQMAYQTTNGGNPWPSEGTYTFKGNDLETLIRNDGIEITIISLTPSELILAFNFNTVSGGRVGGITGGFVFSLTK